MLLASFAARFGLYAFAATCPAVGASLLPAGHCVGEPPLVRKYQADIG
jgi:hypothetical protein